MLQYFDDNLRPTTFECGALLAGITMDTKHFAFNTGARTFEAASYLRRNGADNTTVKMMFQDDMQTYRSRAKCGGKRHPDGAGHRHIRLPAG